jgi:hypothetical protein
MKFDFAKAQAAYANKPAELAFLNGNADAFKALTEESVSAIFAAYFGGDFNGVVNGLLTPQAMTDQMVVNSADVATRQAAAKDRMLAFAEVAARFIMGVIAAGVVF